MSWRFAGVVASVFSITSIGSALAQEGKTSLDKWAGFYAGVSAGYTWSQPNGDRTSATSQFANLGLGGGAAFASTAAALANTNSLPVTTNGFIGGGQVGYNHPVAEKFLAGVEVDFQGVLAGDNKTVVMNTMGPAGNANFPISQTLSFSSNVNFLNTARGRLGYAVTPDLLFFGTGGLAFGQVNSSTTITQTPQNSPALPNSYSATGSASAWLVGFTVGGGVEWWVAPKWSIKAEYLYYDLGSLTYSLGPLQSYNINSVLFNSTAATATAVFNGSVVRAGVNVHF